MSLNTPRILVGALQPGARPLNIGVNGARRGVAEFGNTRMTVIVKSVNPKELAAECFCALLANDLGMRSPQCAIVQENNQWLFASVFEQYPNFSQAFNIDPNAPDAAVLEAAVIELADWAGIGKLFAFDVLVQNDDRNIGNLLVDNADYLLIDHSRSMGAWTYARMQPIFNYMKTIMVPDDQLKIRGKAVAAALTFPRGCHTLTCSDLASAHTLVSPFATDFDVLIADRLASISSLVATDL